VKIVRLEAENVKRLVAVEITPDGSLVVIGGKNGAGKSSTIDSIAMALGGKDLVPERPLRDGAERGHVEVDLGDLVVRRTFTAAGGGTLTVSNREGARYPSPQGVLDELTGRLTFDPLAFSRMDARRQLETLRALVGVDFSEIDRARAELYQERTAVNRTAAQLAARIASMPRHEGAPEEEVSVAALMKELDAAVHAAREAEEADERAVVAQNAVDRAGVMIAEMDQEIAALEARAKVLLAERNQLARRQSAELLPEAETKEAEANRLRGAVPSQDPIRSRIASADEQNRRRRENLEREACEADHQSAKREAARLSEEIEALDRTKETTLSAAAFPVPGLSFDDTGVLFNGIPFSQASSAEQLRVSVAMGAAMNPRLRVLLVRDGSLLDEDSLRLLAAMAEEHGLQVWLERVGEGAECSVVIEDGTVREVRRQAPDLSPHDGAQSGDMAAAGAKDF